VVPPSYLIGFPGKAAAFILDTDQLRPPCQMLSDGLFHLCQPGTNGLCFRIEATSNCVDWVPFAQHRDGCRDPFCGSGRGQFRSPLLPSAAETNLPARLGAGWQAGRNWTVFGIARDLSNRVPGRSGQWRCAPEPFSDGNRSLSRRNRS